ncbi:MAG: PspC domain-containing protein, partial [Actinomycetota bacterium]|nr:PspC domain-containing protein [Actinomycetota bacterium]
MGTSPEHAPVPQPGAVGVPEPVPVPKPVPAPEADPATRAVLRRGRSGRVVGGVASGIADHLGVPVLWVRMVFVVLAALGGAGLLGYGLLWAFVPEGADTRPRPSTAREQQQAIGLVALGVGLALAAAALGDSWSGWVTGPLGVALVGAAVVWREADETQRRRWMSGAGAVFGGTVFGGGRTGVLRVLAGVGLVVAGITVFLLNQVDLGQVQFGLLAVVATLVGVAVLTVPWWLRLVRDLGEERRARIRTEERTEIAAHLHDSVLQTLALIQQQSDSGREVRRLARGQERELRSWLYGPLGYGRADQGAAQDVASRRAPATLSETLAATAGEIEDTYAASVEVVAVGDCPADEALASLVLASREALVNAAKHAGVGEVSLYAEVEPTEVHVFVRDRGAGFDPAAVPEDRHGLADSIHGRMERHGGTAKVRT